MGDLELLYFDDFLPQGLQGDNIMVIPISQSVKKTR